MPSTGPYTGTLIPMDGGMLTSHGTASFGTIGVNGAFGQSVPKYIDDSPEPMYFGDDLDIKNKYKSI